MYYLKKCHLRFNIPEKTPPVVIVATTCGHPIVFVYKVIDRIIV